MILLDSRRYNSLINLEQRTERQKSSVFITVICSETHILSLSIAFLKDKHLRNFQFKKK